MENDEIFEKKRLIAKINVTKYLEIAGSFHFFEDDINNSEISRINYYIKFLAPKSSEEVTDYSAPKLPFAKYGLDDFIADCKTLGANPDRSNTYLSLYSSDLRILANQGVKFGEFHRELCAALGGIEINKSFRDR